jgi:cytochrome c-type biogenesis protein CcmH
MHSRPILALAVSLLLETGGSALAVLPDEVLADPALEQRARELSGQLRCMVCQNQSIDDSDAELARDLRILVRERLTAGDTDQQVLEYLVARYGEFVLLKPAFSARNTLLWLAPVALLVLGGATVFLAARRQQKSKAVVAPLSESENERISRILRDGS